MSVNGFTRPKNKMTDGQIFHAPAKSRDFAKSRSAALLIETFLFV